MSADPREQLRLSHFANLVGTEVQIDFGAGAVSATIFEARSIGSHTPRPEGGFSVMLKANTGTRPDQGVFRFVHPQLGELELFMVPRRLEGPLTVYEITVN